MKMKTVACLVLATLGIYELVPHSSAVATPDFKLGILTYYNTCCFAFSGEITHGAISIAVDHLVRDRVLTHGNFSVIWRDARSPSAAAGNVVDYVLYENVDVIIGSPLSPGWPDVNNFNVENPPAVGGFPLANVKFHVVSEYITEPFTSRLILPQPFCNKNKNIVDIMIQRLEKYACNLEYIVDQRTQQLMDEKQKTDSLLYRMIPKPIAIKLKMGETVVPELFASATVFFSDIVGFTGIAVRSSPIEVVDLLNDLYTHFDEIIERYDAYRLETIGDAYLVVSGIPKRNGAVHAGVVGVSMPRYCLFGDTVNTASRMESNGESQKIHLSHSAHMALLDIGGYRMTFRQEMEIKGKGLMKTFWLLGKQERVVATDEMLLE